MTSAYCFPSRLVVALTLGSSPKGRGEAFPDTLLPRKRDGARELANGLQTADARICPGVAILQVCARMGFGPSQPWLGSSRLFEDVHGAIVAGRVS